MSTGSILSLLPPLLALLVAFTTKRVYLSLWCGILSSAFIVTDFHVLDAGIFAFNRVLNNLDLDRIFSTEKFWTCWNAFICIFLIFLGIIIQLIHHSGGAYAYKTFVKKFVTNAKQAEISSLILSKFLFIDDYFSTLTVGSVMKPVTDMYRVPRAKLAYMVDALSAPLAVLCPISSWVAAIIGFLRVNGVHHNLEENTRIFGSPFIAYLNILPYVFYSYVLVGLTWFIVLKRISFGKMRQHEEFAVQTGDVLFGRDYPQLDMKTLHQDKASLWDFLVPILSLGTCGFLGLAASGQWSLFGGPHSFGEALRHSRAASGLFQGGSVALIFTTCFLLARKRLHWREIPMVAKQGFKLMLPAIMILLLAWTMGDILRDDLHTGQYLASLTLEAMDLKFLPFLFFVTSLMISFAIGSSWGTATIMFPIGIEMYLSYKGFIGIPDLNEVQDLFPMLGAILSGAVAGDHISPISDTTIMSSTSTSMLHQDHVETQFTYAFPIILVTMVGFLLLPFYSELIGTTWDFLFSVVSAWIVGALILGGLHKWSNREPSKLTTLHS